MSDCIFRPVVESSESHVLGIQNLTNEIAADVGVAHACQK